MYKAIFTDIDDTILDYRRSSSHALGLVCNQLEIDFDEGVHRLYLEIDDFVWTNNPYSSVEEIIKKRAELFTHELFCPERCKEFQLLMQKALALSADLIPGAEAMIKSLSKKYLLFAASNGHISVQTARFEKADILKYYKALFVSDDIGYEKPDIRFFKEILKRSGFSKDEVLMIGDSLRCDIKGAYDFGIDACFYNPRNKNQCHIAKFTISHLEDLINLLD